MSVEWILVDAGVCLFGDRARPVSVPALWWTRTPVTAADLGGSVSGADCAPMTLIDRDEAVRLAGEFGGRLPRSVEWEWMAAGSERRRFPWGDQDWIPARGLLLPSGKDRPAPVGGFPAGATPQGLLDVAGNVWEWTASTVLGGGAVIRGGSYASLALYAQCTFLNAAPAELRSPGIGFRVVREP